VTCSSSGSSSGGLGRPYAKSGLMHLDGGARVRRRAEPGACLCLGAAGFAQPLRSTDPPLLFLGPVPGYNSTPFSRAMQIGDSEAKVELDRLKRQLSGKGPSFGRRQVASPTDVGPWAT
jgi:hypothetical protein